MLVMPLSVAVTDDALAHAQSMDSVEVTCGAALLTLGESVNVFPSSPVGIPLPAVALTVT